MVMIQKTVVNCFNKLLWYLALILQLGPHYRIQLGPHYRILCDCFENHQNQEGSEQSNVQGCSLLSGSGYKT